MREKGDILEEHISKSLGLSYTKNSGAVKGDGDLYGKIIRVEAKATDAQSVSIKKSIWKKILRESGERGNIPILIHGFIEDGKVDEVLVSTDLYYFKHITNPGALFSQRVIEDVRKKLEKDGFDYEQLHKIISALTDSIEQNKLSY